MNKLESIFTNNKVLIPFITCGDPDLETTAAVVRAAVANGADLVELGIPFSDPTAEGPVIQGANLRALSGGVTTDKVFDLVRELRTDVKVPMVFMTYANVVYSYGGTTLKGRGAAVKSAADASAFAQEKILLFFTVSFTLNGSFFVKFFPPAISFELIEYFVMKSVTNI